MIDGVLQKILPGMIAGGSGSIVAGARELASKFDVALDSGVVGFDLSLVAQRLEREDLLRSMILPNAMMAEGFEGPSAMIPVGDHLSRAQIRDLVTYLSTLR